MRVHLSDHFTFKKLFIATIPPILMMVFTSIYGIVDGVFVSNVVGTTAFSAVNLYMPVAMAVGALGFMMGAGGSALTAKVLGEGDRDKANKIFSCVVLFTVILGMIASIIILIFMEKICLFLKATPEMLPYCKVYGTIIISAEIAFMLQNLFQNFFLVAEKPMLGFVVTIIAGCTNIVLDALFIAVFKWGVAGAATATIISQIVGATIPIFYFLNKKNTSLLRLVPAKLNFNVLFKSTTNGSSELLSNISASVVSMIYNAQLLKFSHENGVAAYGTIMYASFIFAAIFIGYSIGTAPIIGYNYGAKNKEELSNVFKKSICINIIFGIVMTGLSVLLSGPMSYVFSSNNKELYELTKYAMKIYSISFIFMGLNMFTSSFFTALNDGLISAIVSCSRTVVFQTSTIIILPILFGEKGIWPSIIIAEGLALIVSIIFLITKRKKYGY